jgi:hypothetical protein
MLNCVTSSSWCNEPRWSPKDISFPASQKRALTDLLNNYHPYNSEKLAATTGDQRNSLKTGSFNTHNEWHGQLDGWHSSHATKITEQRYDQWTCSWQDCRGVMGESVCAAHGPVTCDPYMPTTLPGGLYWHTT